MADSDLDKELREFLEFQAQERSEGVTLKTVAASLKTVVDRQGEHEKKDEDRHKEVMAQIISHERRIVSIEKDVEHLTKDVDRVEQSGSHDVPEILKAAKGLRSDPPRSVPPKSAIGRAFATEAGKAIVKGIVLLIVLAVGWLSHHLTLSWTADSSSQSSPHR